MQPLSMQIIRKANGSLLLELAMQRTSTQIIELQSGVIWASSPAYRKHFTEVYVAPGDIIVCTINYAEVRHMMFKMLKRDKN